MQFSAGLLQVKMSGEKISPYGTLFSVQVRDQRFFLNYDNLF